MEKILRIIEKFIPKRLYRMGQPIYHYLLTLTGAIINRFPARDLYIIGVTGTKGKSTVTEIVNAILEEAGHKTALSNSIRFKIDEKTEPNKHKMSMPGRFFMQNFLRRAAKAACTHAVIEITSEGSRQFRHKFIWLDAFIFTNLAPEHIESHGSYDKYREAKLQIADNLRHKIGKRSVTGEPNSLMIINGDDDEAETFLNRIESGDASANQKNKGAGLKKLAFSLSDSAPIKCKDSIEMRFKKTTLYSPLVGEFNVRNILAAATLADAMAIDHEVIKRAVENLDEIPGRVQKIQASDKFLPKQNFAVVVDYAHTPESLEELYKAFAGRRRICVLGNCGGGRDKWKRPIMARIAEKNCDEIILTNEDPYDEDPRQIVEEMLDAIKHKSAEIIMDRRKAIHAGISRAKKGDAVLISGKGTDPYLMEARGKKTPWSDATVAREELDRVLKKVESK